MSRLLIGVLLVAAAAFFGSLLDLKHRTMGASIAALLAIILLIGNQIASEAWKKWRGDPVQTQHNKNVEEKLDNQIQHSKAIEEKIDRLQTLMGGIETNKKKMLDEEYPGGHKLFAVTKNNKVIQSPKVSDQIQTDWSRISAKDTGNVIEIKVPYLRFMNATFNNATIALPREVGASINILGTPQGVLYAKVLEINENNVIAVLGIKKK